MLLAVSLENSNLEKPLLNLKKLSYFRHILSPSNCYDKGNARAQSLFLVGCGPLFVVLLVVYCRCFAFTLVALVAAVMARLCWGIL